jgi:hypothetical protein
MSGCGGRWQFQQHPQHARDPVAHVATVNDHVECSMLEKELAALETFRQRLPDSLLNDA